MRKTVIVLSLTAALFAASTAYLVWQLHSAREELAAARVMPASAPANRTSPNELGVAAPGTSAAAPLAAGGQEPVPQAGPSKKEIEAGARAGQYQANAYMRRLLADPERRAKMERDARKSLERELSGIAKSLELTEDEYQRLLDIVTGQQMRYADSTSHCADTPGCDINAVAGAQFQAQRRELADFMGAEKAQRFADYRDNFMERNTVAGLRADLPDRLQLSDSQAEKLANALGDERRRVVKEWEQRGAGNAMTGNSLGILYYPNNVQDIEERVAEAGEFQRRQRERAAEMLSAAQLEAFTERQKEILEVVRSGWEAEEKANSSQ